VKFIANISMCDPTFYVPLARAAEAAGFDTVAVPDSIAYNELWPKQNADPSYFEREHIEVLPGGGLRQKPGPWNALGFIKFNLPNRYTVYLHDTPSRELFSHAVRTFSHGCMRIEKPVDLATYLLRDVPGWTRERVIAEAATRERAQELVEWARERVRS
jgi:murein L,D-transpeptidase YcbB/YkuD